jgi:glycolate oxidase iron-sulfur subunit
MMVNKRPQALKDLIARCFRCGLCRAVCPVFLQVGRESAVARGKLQLILAMSEGSLQPSGRLADLLSRCLACGLCEQACPADVHVTEAILRARAELVRSHDRAGGEGKKAILAGGRWRKYLHTLRSSPDQPLPAILELLSEIRGQKAIPMPQTSIFSNLAQPEAPSDPRMKVAYFSGCGDIIYPQIARDVLNILAKSGVKSFVAEQPACCGALFLEAGDFAAARQLARATIATIEGENIEAIVVGDIGCARTLRRDYLELLGLDKFSVPVYDICELLAHELSPPIELLPLSRKVIYLPSRGRGTDGDWGKKLLARIPQLELVEVGASQVCCGESLFFSAVQPELFRQILTQTLALIAGSGCKAVVTDNLICKMQLEWALGESGMNVKVLHIVELVAESLELEKDLSVDFSPGPR